MHSAVRGKSGQPCIVLCVNSLCIVETWGLLSAGASACASMCAGYLCAFPSKKYVLYTRQSLSIHNTHGQTCNWRLGKSIDYTKGECLRKEVLADLKISCKDLVSTLFPSVVERWN